jgi:nucleoside 2-deoxyribosyltransferase
MPSIQHKCVCFISGPFRPSDPLNQWEQEQNIRRAEALALEVWRIGAVAIAPHLNTRTFSGSLPDEVWLSGDLAILAKCDAVVLTPDWARSSGATAERAFALDRGIPVFEQLSELQDWIRSKAA